MCATEFEEGRLLTGDDFFELQAEVDLPQKEQNPFGLFFL